MFIIVSYLLGWPHKKLTMSLIDLFPSANDVSTEPHVTRVHSSVLLAIIDSYYLPLMIILIICCEQKEYHLKALPQNMWCCELHESLIIPDQGPSVCDTELDTNNGRQEERQRREDCQQRKQVNVLTYFKLHHQS